MKLIFFFSGFHLHASKGDSEKLLSTKPPGTYLTRFSSEPGSFGLSCVVAEGFATKVLHFRIKYTPGLGYEFDEKLFVTFDDFVEEVRGRYGLTSVLPASDFGNSNTSAYVDKFAKPQDKS